MESKRNRGSEESGIDAPNVPRVFPPATSDQKAVVLSYVLLFLMYVASLVILLL